MNFNFTRFLYLAISYILGTFFFIIGIFSIILPWSSYLQGFITHFIQEQSLILSLFGIGFILTGLSIVLYTSLRTRRHYLSIRTGNLSVHLDQNVVESYLRAYWEEHFPQSHIPFSLNFKKQTLQIVADLPFVPPDDQKAFLEKVKDDFDDLFGRVLGYPYDVHLFASFQEKRVEKAALPGNGT